LSYQPERVLPAIQRDLRAFVGATAWEELARQWVVTQRETDALGFSPEVVGSQRYTGSYLCKSPQQRYNALIALLRPVQPNAVRPRCAGLH
jgi:hypothetical protein